MNIFKHEVKAYAKNTVLWIASLILLVAVMMLFYPAIRNDIDNFVKMLEKLPKVMQDIFGMQVSIIGSPIGFYSFLYLYASIFCAIQAMNMGVGIVSKEQSERTADFLLTKPVSRQKIFTAKLFAAVTLFAVTNILYTLASYAVILAVAKDSFDTDAFIRINLSLFFLQLIFFSMGLIVSVGARKIKAVLPVSLGIVFGFYAVSAFAVTSTEDKLRYFTPFQYFKPEYIIQNGRYETVFVIIGGAVILISLLVSYAVYQRKDIHSV